VAIARIVVDISSREVSSAFDYEIPPALAGRVGVGCAVLVPFGPRSVVGWVVGLAETTEVARVKPIIALLSDSLFTQAGADLALRIAEEYVSALPEAVRLMLPPGTSPRAMKVVGDDGEIVWRLAPPAVKPAEERLVSRIEGTHFEPAATARLQRAVLNALAAGPVTTSELAAEFGSVSAVIKRLEAVGAVEVIERRRFRTPSGAARTALRHEVLSPGQQEALDASLQVFREGGTVLLDGVTGSGKTEVYLRAIEEVLASGGGAIVLVPEISLTPQTVGRFRSRFGEGVAVLHSRLSLGERLDEWDRARSGEARVVVGARSALFAPVHNLGLVIIDEEHESSYKQGSSPRYHARTVAEWLCEAAGAGLVLGSATPAFESLAAAQKGRYRHVVLPERVAGGALPHIDVVDMASEFNEGFRSMFSRRLQAGLKEVAQGGHKAVLLLNRRGFASFLLCRECSFVPTCDSCSTSLTYHEHGSFLACHHCASRSPVPAACPKCGSPYLRQFGAGTQRVVTELEALMPGLPVVRMDADTTAGKGGHEKMLGEFEALDSGVLVGTQMVAKGLDYPEVTLVGVLSADTTLHLPDFRAGERTWQLLSQVAGRAGRGPLGGSVVIQTYWPDHPAVRAAATGQREPLLAEEYAARGELGYPPFGRLANIIVSAPEEAAARLTAESIATALAQRLPEGARLLGPSPAPLAKLKRAYRWHVLLKAPLGATLAPSVRAAVSAARKAEGASVAVDIDPVDLL